MRNKISPNMRRLLDFLGPEYSNKSIDTEDCLYKKISDKYDIEVSGCNRKGNKMTLYVWDITKGKTLAAQMIESIQDIKDEFELRDKLLEVEEKYSAL